MSSSLTGFDIINRLGSGSFGTVYKVRRHADTLVYVIKSVRIVELSGREQLEAINEVTILSKMNSPFVVRYYDSFIDQDSLHIVMEYCNRGDLQTLLKKAKEKNMSSLKENVTWNIFLQIVLGLHYLHNQKILHRDLKTANVFLMKDDSQPYFLVKIGDLGVAKLLETSTAFAKTIVGTPYYLSPELCADQPYRDKSDCWALGVLLYECLTLRHPFEARNQCALIMKIIQAQFAAPASASAEMVNLVTWLLQKDPSHRPSIRDLLNEEYIRKKLGENDFELPTSMSEYTQATSSVLTAPAIDFLGATTTTTGGNGGTASTTTLLGAASNRAPSAGNGGATGEQTLFPSLQATVNRNNSNNRNGNNDNGVSRQNSGNQATVQSQMPVLGGAGGVSRKNQQGTGTGTGTGAPYPRSGRSQAAPSSSSSSAAAGASGADSSVAGNRVRGKKKVSSEKAKVVHQVRKPSSTKTANISSAADAKDSNGHNSNIHNNNNNNMIDDEDSYAMAQEKEAVRQLEEVLIKEAQSKTSYLRSSLTEKDMDDSGIDVESDSKDNHNLHNNVRVGVSVSVGMGVKEARSSAKIIEYDLKLDESISRQHINLNPSPTDAKPGSFFFTDIDSNNKKPASKQTDQDDDDDASYDDDFEVDEDGDFIEEDIAGDDEENAYIDQIMQADLNSGNNANPSPTEKRRRGSSLDDDGFTAYSKEDLKRNIEDLIDLVNVSRDRAINAMGQSLFGQVYDTCLDSMDLNKNAFAEDAIDPSSPFIIKLEQILYDKMPERNIEEVLSVVFSVKVLIAMENRLRSLQDLEGAP